jgi:hypothetical protein
LGHAATLRFLSPLIEPDMQISPIKCGAPHFEERFLFGGAAEALQSDKESDPRRWTKNVLN